VAIAPLAGPAISEDIQLRAERNLDGDAPIALPSRAIVALPIVTRQVEVSLRGTATGEQPFDTFRYPNRHSQSWPVESSCPFVGTVTTAQRSSTAM
jgi:hypothetical protein